MSGKPYIALEEQQQAQKLATTLDSGRTQALFDDAYKQINQIIEKDKDGSAYRILSRAEQLEQPGVGLDLALIDTMKPGSQRSYFHHYVGTNRETVAGNGIGITDPYDSLLGKTGVKIYAWPNATEKKESYDGKIGVITSYPDNNHQETRSWGPAKEDNFTGLSYTGGYRTRRDEEQEAQKIAKMLDTGRSSETETAVSREIQQVKAADKDGSAYRILARTQELEKPGVGLDLAVILTRKPGSANTYFQDLIGWDRHVFNDGGAAEITQPGITVGSGKPGVHTYVWSNGTMKQESYDGKAGHVETYRGDDWESTHRWGPNDYDNYDTGYSYIGPQRWTEEDARRQQEQIAQQQKQQQRPPQDNGPFDIVHNAPVFQLLFQK